MFHFLLAVLLVVAGIHAYRLSERTLRRSGEVVLLYVLVGYCGVPMLAAAVVSLWNGPWVADLLGFPAGNPFQAFVGVALLGMSLTSVLALRYRGDYLVAPALCWAVFFLGATFIHAHDFHASGALTHGSALMIFASHGFVSVVLLAALVVSRAGREPA